MNTYLATFMSSPEDGLKTSETSNCKPFVNVLTMESPGVIRKGPIMFSFPQKQTGN